MRKAMAICLITCLTSLPAVTQATEPYELAPPVPPWPPRLPPPQRVPGGVFLPTDLEKAQDWRDLFLDRYRGLCQTSMNQQASVMSAKCDAQRDDDAAKALQSSDKRSADAEAHRMTFAKGATISGITAVVTAALLIWAESKRKP